MAITVSLQGGGTATLKELYEGYEAGLDPSRGPYINKYYVVDYWANAFKAADALVGIGRTPVGHQCPESPGLTCVSARVIPEAVYDVRDGGRPQFNLGKIEATYSVLTWDASTSDDPDQSFPTADGAEPFLYMEQSIDWSIETIPLPNTSYKFSDGTVVQHPVNYFVPVAEFVLVRRWQSKLPYANVTAYLGSLNSATFLGQPKGQIQFFKCAARRQFTTDGTVSQEVAYTFKWRKFDHNQIPRPDKIAFDFIRDPTGNFPYAYTDLSPLLA